MTILWLKIGIAQPQTYICIYVEPPTRHSDSIKNNAFEYYNMFFLCRFRKIGQHCGNYNHEYTSTSNG
jgi:hypothetical protein